jgi:hypothetical protein
MTTIINSSIDYTEFVGKLWSEIIIVSPDPSDLPSPPQSWLVNDHSMVLLDSATEEALRHYWAGQVKACQYAIFHIC